MMVRAAVRRWKALSVVLSTVSCLGACGARTGLPLPKCGDPGIQCTPAEKTDSKVIFFCNVELSGFAAIVFGSDHSGIIPVCLPASLNKWIGDPTQVDAIIDFDGAVQKYGTDTVVEQLAALKSLDLNGQFCSDITDAVNNPNTTCMRLRGTRDSFCENPANFAAVPCAPTECHNTTNRDGSINPHACACNTTSANRDDCNLPGATLVIPPPGTGDRLGQTSGALQRRNHESVHSVKAS
jgi:hypothetical protein